MISGNGGSILFAISCGQTEVAQEKKELRTRRCSTPQGWLLWTYLKLAYGHHHCISSQTRQTSPCCGSSLSRQAYRRSVNHLILLIPQDEPPLSSSPPLEDVWAPPRVVNLRITVCRNHPHKGGRTDLQPSVWTWNRTCYWLPPHLSHHLTPTPYLRPACLRAPLILKLNHIHLNLHLLPTHRSSIPYHPI